MEQLYIFLGGFFGFSILYAILYFFFSKRNSAKLAEWLKSNPTASKVYCKSSNLAIITSQIEVETIDDQVVEHKFSEGTKVGFYILPGKHILSASCRTSRPGVFYRSVNKVYGPLKLEVEIEPSSNYQLDFDRKSEEFNFSLIDNYNK